MILDTNVVIDFIRGKEGAIKKIEELEKRNIPFSLTSVSVFEIWQGKNKDKLTKINFLLESFGIFSFDVPSAKEAGSIRANLKNKGNVIDAVDCMIAGIAKTNRESILTNNTKHFNRIEGLHVEAY